MNFEKINRQALHYENLGKMIKEAVSINNSILEINEKINIIFLKKNQIEKNYNKLK